jgi:hypothetical protein
LINLVVNNEQKVGQLPGYKLTAINLSVVGAGHARDEDAKTKYYSPNIAGMARSYSVILLNLMAVGYKLAS